jgi:6-phosphogluconate dehydrogenase
MVAEKGLLYLGMGVSGGEEGARRGALWEVCMRDQKERTISSQLSLAEMLLSAHYVGLLTQLLCC